MKARIHGTIVPPRGTPGANGAYMVDLVVEIPDVPASAPEKLRPSWTALSKSWRKVLVTIEDDSFIFDAWDVGTTWNGFTDYAVDEPTWNAIKERYLNWISASADDDVREATQGMDDIEADGAGIVHLGGGAFVILQETQGQE